MNTRPQTLLSTLWIFVILNIFARDFHELGRPGMLEQVMSGVVDGVTVTDELMLLGGIMFEVFIIMVMLSQVLTYKINRCANMVMGLVAIMVVFMTNLNPDLDNIFFMVIELIALVSIIVIAWRWKNETPESQISAS